MNVETIRVESPSNIAFVKYWGKKPIQIPMNPSLSMTLSKCVTKMDVHYRLEEQGKGVSALYFEKSLNEKFRNKFNQYLNLIVELCPYVKKLSLEINSENSFPHSAGIASSASAMSAFALAIYEIGLKHNFIKANIELVSELARLGSGSACRSILSDYAIWGRNPLTDEGSDRFAIELKEYHQEFSQVCDSILIVSSEEKSVSSSAGHKLMDHHIFRENRLMQALENIRVLTHAMSRGDWKTFGEILEMEALTLHALMMTSSPSYILLEANSLNIIKKVRQLREKDENLKLYFTIDAGPNIHLIYPKYQETHIHKLIDQELSEFFHNVIHDEIGVGAKVL